MSDTRDGGRRGHRILYIMVLYTTVIVATSAPFPTSCHLPADLDPCGTVLATRSPGDGNMPSRTNPPHDALGGYDGAPSLEEYSTRRAQAAHAKCRVVSHLLCYCVTCQPD